jgi:biopolymer transport protein ExbD
MLEISGGGAPSRHAQHGSEDTVHFRPQRKRYTQPSVLMTLSRFAPMIDMSFLLLVFFMTTTRFSAPEGLLSSQMPAYGAGGTGPAIALPLTPLVMRVAAAGPNASEMSVSIDRFESAPRNLIGLPEFLTAVLAEPGFDVDTPMIIVADDAVHWDHVVNAWNAALRAGWKNIAFAAP